MSQDGRVLMTVCRSHEDVPKALSFYHRLGDRLAVRSRTNPPLAGLIAAEG